MSPELKILADLKAGPTTADSLAPRLGLTTEQSIALLVTMKREGKVTSAPLAGLRSVHVYRLSETAWQSLGTKS